MLPSEEAAVQIVQCRVPSWNRSFPESRPTDSINIFLWVVLVSYLRQHVDDHLSVGVYERGALCTDGLW